MMIAQHERLSASLPPIRTQQLLKTGPLQPGQHNSFDFSHFVTSLTVTLPSSSRWCGRAMQRQEEIHTGQGEGEVLEQVKRDGVRVALAHSSSNYNRLKKKTSDA